MYCSLIDLQTRYGAEEILDLAELDSGGLDETRINQAIEDASATIDGYVSSRYTLPLVDVPNLLVLMCCELARYQLYDESVSEHLENKHKQNIKTLEQLASGKLTLGLNDAHQEPTTNDSATITSHGSVWARDKSKGFI